MASSVALKPFDTIQLGREATKGTIVPATRRLVAQGMLKEVIERYYSNYPRGINATIGGDGIVTRKATEFEVSETELTPHEVLWPLLTGITGNVTPSGTTSYTWLFSPTVTSEPGLDSATAEFALSDGTTNHVTVQAAYVMTRSFKVAYAVNQPVKLMSWKGFGRARQSGAPTAALTVYPTRQILISNLTSWFADPSWATLGATQLAAIVRSASLEVECFPEPDYTMDGRADLDMVSHRIKPFGAKLDMTLELNSVGAAEYANWRAGTRRFIRAKTLGISLGASNYTFQFDGSFRITDATFSDDNGQRLVSLTMEAVYDTTGTKILDFTVINDIATVAGL